VTSCIVDSVGIYIMVVKFWNTICSPPPQLSLHRRAALSSNSNGTRSVYTGNRKSPLWYCEMSMVCYNLTFSAWRHHQRITVQWIRRRLISVNIYTLMSRRKGKIKLRVKKNLKIYWYQGCGSDQDPDWIRIQWLCGSGSGSMGKKNEEKMHFFLNFVDPDCGIMLDPDLDWINLDPQPWLILRFIL
jgi:hypothetical protein